MKISLLCAKGEGGLWSHQNEFSRKNHGGTSLGDAQGCHLPPRSFARERSWGRGRKVLGCELLPLRIRELSHTSPQGPDGCASGVASPTRCGDFDPGSQLRVANEPLVQFCARGSSPSAHRSPTPSCTVKKPLSCLQCSTGGLWPFCVFPPPVGLPAPSKVVLSSLIPSTNATKSFTLI